MMERYVGVTTRYLRAEERCFSYSEQQTPLVIEPLNSPSMGFLGSFLHSHSTKVLEDIAIHGAVLFRGFDFTSIAEFERQVLSIDGIQAMSEMFMSEPGRRLVDGTKFVYHTNTLFKTGGTLAFGGFHTENYYIPDVPRFISFFCLKPSRIGGETGLVNTAKLFNDLDSELRRKLEGKAYHVHRIPFSSIASRYKVEKKQIEQFCSSVKLKITSYNDEHFVDIFKPSVIVHPITKESALTIHFSEEFNKRRFDQKVLQYFLGDYDDMWWLLHRINWKYPALLRYAKSIYAYFRHPMRLLQQARDCFFKSELGAPVALSPRSERLEDHLTDQEIDTLAIAIRNRFSSFYWRRGDVIIIDNLKIAHAGMPGYGSRELRVLLCNRVPLPCSSDAPGRWAPAQSEFSECLGSLLLRQAALKS
jgi:alpha-ketoglutarate-dependent taurine dioxygenase